MPAFRRTLSGWLNLLLATGFVIERVCEPRADEGTAKKYPVLSDARIMAFFLVVLLRKA